MRTVCILLGFLGCLILKAQTVDTTCSKIKDSITYRVIQRGEIVHRKCKDGRNTFFYTPYDPQEKHGYLKNRSQIFGMGWNITSHGPTYFVVTNKSGTATETYNFITQEWSSGEVKPPTWSTGERDEEE